MSVFTSLQRRNSILPLPELNHVQREALRALPFEIVSGLRILRDEPAPAITRPELWVEIAMDAIMLAADGWARQALDLGWRPLELFGCPAEATGDDDRLGLAASLARRRVLAITEEAARVTDGSCRRSLYRRDRGDAGLVNLWEYGR